MIYVSFPRKSNDYPWDSVSWAQIAHFVVRYLKAAFPNQVVEIPYNTIPDFKPEDIFVGNIPNKAILSTNRVVLIDNDSLQTDKWKDGTFRKYGLNLKMFELGTSTLDYFYDHILVAFIKTNTIAIKQWNEDNPYVKEKKDFLLSKCKVYPMQHPIDKKFFGRFYNPNKIFNSSKMHVLSLKHLPKHSHMLIEILNKLGYKYSVSEWTNSQEPSLYLTHNIFGYTSYSEGFPYIGNEFMCSGMFFFGNEEWWDGYGLPHTTWTYDPTRYEENIENIKWLMNSNNVDEVERLRHELRLRHIENKENNWSYFMTKVISEIKCLL